MGNTPRNIIFWSGMLLTPSETFIRAQARTLRRFTPHFAGVRYVRNGSLLSRDECLLLNRDGLVGPFAEAAFKFAGIAPRLTRRLTQLAPALIHAHHGVNGALALPLARSLRLPLIVTFYGADATVERAAMLSPTQWLFRKRADRLKRETTLFIAVSDFIKRKLVERGYPPGKIITHYYGVDTREFRPDPTIEREPVVLFVGRLAEKKGVEYLIRAMERVQPKLPRLRVVIIGDGPLRAALQTQAASLRQCTFLGLQPPNVVKEWMNRALIMATPSVTASSGDSEGLPTVLVEAQAMGLPVVASRHAGIPEAITDGETGLLAPERDFAKLGEHIDRLCSDSSLWNTLSLNGRRQAECRFDIRQQTRALEDMYSELIERHRVKQTIQSDRPDEAIPVGSGN